MARHRDNPHFCNLRRRRKVDTGLDDHQRSLRCDRVLYFAETPTQRALIFLWPMKCCITRLRHSTGYKLAQHFGGTKRTTTTSPGARAALLRQFAISRTAGVRKPAENHVFDLHPIGINNSRGFRPYPTGNAHLGTEPCQHGSETNHHIVKHDRLHRGEIAVSLRSPDLGQQAINQRSQYGFGDPSQPRAVVHRLLAHKAVKFRKCSGVVKHRPVFCSQMIDRRGVRELRFGFIPLFPYLLEGIFGRRTP